MRKNLIIIIAGWSSLVARRAHNPKVAGSNPVPATKWSRGVAVNMPACHAGDRRFDPGRDRHFHLIYAVLVKCGEDLIHTNGLVAQSVEQRTENPCVGGSIPSQATIYLNDVNVNKI
jgi:hypothetical protein